MFTSGVTITPKPSNRDFVPFIETNNFTYSYTEENESPQTSTYYGINSFIEIPNKKRSKFSGFSRQIQEPLQYLMTYPSYTIPPYQSYTDRPYAKYSNISTPSPLPTIQVEMPAFITNDVNNTVNKKSFIEVTKPYIETPTDISQPTTQYVESTTQYVEPTTQYIEPTTQYVEPTTQYIEPTTQYIEPTTQYVEPTIQYIEPTTQYVEPTMQ